MRNVEATSWGPVFLGFVVAIAQLGCSGEDGEDTSTGFAATGGTSPSASGGSGAWSAVSGGTAPATGGAFNATGGDAWVGGSGGARSDAGGTWNNSGGAWSGGSSTGGTANAGGWSTGGDGAGGWSTGGDGAGGWGTGGDGAGGWGTGGDGAGGWSTGGDGAGGWSTGGDGAGGWSTGGSATGGSSGANCTLCHGDPVSNRPAPPMDTSGSSDTTSAGVGAHAKHLASSTWHRQGQCADCHVLPTSVQHADGVVDFTWGSPSNANSASPSFDTATLSCAGSYCHGSTLAGAGSSMVTPVWNQVDGTWNACGTACHGAPPPPSTGHPESTSCEICHSSVIASFLPGASPTVVWEDASLHVNGMVEYDALTCTSCHGSGSSAAPPVDTLGNTADTAPGVGAHEQHLADSSWHRQGQCGDCHAMPTSTGHSNGVVDFTWGFPSDANGAIPNFDTSALTCAGAYCHGTELADQTSNVGHVPVWNMVNGTWDACGSACHSNPPGGTHPASTTCQDCHGMVIATFNGTNSTWQDASLHIDGEVEVTQAACGSCHTIPPARHCDNHTRFGCADCHDGSPSTTSAPSTNHNDGVVNFKNNARNLTMSGSPGNVTCVGGCHGSESWNQCPGDAGDD